MSAARPRNRRLRLVPVPELKAVIRDGEAQPVRGAPGAREPGLEALPSHGESLLGASGKAEDVGDVDPRPALLHREVLLACNRERLAKVLDSRVGVAKLTYRRSQRVQSDRLGLPVADRACDRDRLAGALLGLRKAPLDHAPLRELGQQLGSLGALLALGKQIQPLAHGLDRGVVLVLTPQRLAQPFVEERGAAGIGRGIDEAERTA